MRAEEALIDRWHGKAKGRIRVSAGVRVEPNCSPALLQRCDALAKERDLIVQFHACVNWAQVEWVRKRWGMPTIEWMDSLGVLNDRWVLTHMAAVTDRDIDRVRERGVHVCHNPGATLHGAYGAIQHGKFPELIERGVKVVIGCDSTAANNSLDMFRAMYQVATAHKETRIIPDLISPEKALEMVTVDAAEVFRWEEIGSLEKGKKADVIVVDCSKSNWTPNYPFALVPNLVYSGEGRDVETVLIDGKVAGALRLADEIRPESRQAIDALHARDVQVVMITGDAEAVAASVAAELGIDRFFAGVRPEDKASKVKQLQDEGRKVAMVGDGVNDAPALSQADVGIAIGAGTDVAIASAGVILASDDPRSVLSVIELSRASYRKMKQNLWWAAGYNLISVPLAAGILAPIGFVLPMSVGAILMSLSTIVVALNAQLLRRLDLTPDAVIRR